MRKDSGTGPLAGKTTAGSEAMRGHEGLRAARGRRELRRIGTEFVLAFALIWAALVAAGGSHSRAHAVPLPTIDSQAFLEGSSRAGQHMFVAHRAGATVAPRLKPDRWQILLLGLATAAIAAFNFAFWRHLRRVYASPRRNVWRRG